MSIFDKFFGSKQKTATDTTLKQATTGTREVTTAEAQETQQKQITSGVTTQDTTQQQTVTQLDEQTQAILQQLIQGLSGSFTEGGGTVLDPSILEASAGNIDFSNFLSSRAMETEGVLGGSTEAIIAEARRQGENALEIQGTQLAMGAGSNLNSIVQAAQAQGQSDLATQLAALQGQLGIQARQVGSQDLATAFGARSEAARGGADISIAGQTAGVQSIAQLVAALTGATTETTGQISAVGTTEEQSQLEALVSSLQELVETSDTVSTTQQTGLTKQTGQDSIFGTLANVVGAFRG